MFVFLTDVKQRSVPKFEVRLNFDGKSVTVPFSYGLARCDQRPGQHLVETGRATADPTQLASVTDCDWAARPAPMPEAA
jgi:hypothetical protein